METFGRSSKGKSFVLVRSYCHIRACHGRVESLESQKCSKRLLIEFFSRGTDKWRIPSIFQFNSVVSGRFNGLNSSSWWYTDKCARRELYVNCKCLRPVLYGESWKSNQFGTCCCTILSFIVIGLPTNLTVEMEHEQSVEYFWFACSLEKKKHFNVLWNCLDRC